MGYWEEGGDDKSYDDACTAMVNLVKAKVSRSFQDFVVRAERGGGGGGPFAVFFMWSRIMSNSRTWRLGEKGCGCSFFCDVGEEEEGLDSI